MLQKIPVFILTFILTSSSNAQLSDSTYLFRVNLEKLVNDQLIIELRPPKFKKNELIFRLPRMVPGIYATLNFGKNIENVRAFDSRGKELQVMQLDTNSWKISNAIALQKITYAVNDDWEDFNPSPRQLVYRSPGSSFSKELFLVNNNSLFGYFEGYDHLPVLVQVNKPTKLYAATSLKKTREESTRVEFSADDHHQLIDNPILFAPADTAKIKLDDVSITVACHSTSGQKIAKSIAAFITPLLRSQKDYLGGQLPVKDYTFIIFHQAGKDSLSTSFDGLEHSQSTVILLNMFLNTRLISQAVYSVASHEFFHTIIPLALHSEEIEYYDFNHPVMSKHLWLYEGMTDYFTMHMPVKQGLKSVSQFLPSIEDKIKSMLTFDSSLTLASLGRQSIERQDQYLNAYMRGALVSLCLDILLREYSKGTYGVQELTRDLLKEYGRKRPFRDEDLYGKIAQLARNNSVRDFLEKYIEGPFLPPLKEYLEKAGITITDKNEVRLINDPSPSQIAIRRAWLGQ